MQIKSERLLPQLAKLVERFDLDTAETEVLTQWGSTVTESPSLNFYQALRMLKDGLKELPSIMDNEVIEEIAFVATAQSMENVRYAAVTRERSGLKKYILYLGR